MGLISQWAARPGRIQKTIAPFLRYGAGWDPHAGRSPGSGGGGGH
jgi:hypothetical protein